MNVSRFMNLAAIFSLDLESQYKVCLVWFHFRLTAGKPLTGYRIAFSW